MFWRQNWMAISWINWRVTRREDVYMHHPENSPQWATCQKCLNYNYAVDSWWCCPVICWPLPRSVSYPLHPSDSLSFSLTSPHIRRRWQDNDVMMTSLSLSRDSSHQQSRRSIKTTRSTQYCVSLAHISQSVRDRSKSANVRSAY